MFRWPLLYNQATHKLCIQQLIHKRKDNSVLPCKNLFPNAHFKYKWVTIAQTENIFFLQISLILNSQPLKTLCMQLLDSWEEKNIILLNFLNNSNIYFFENEMYTSYVKNSHSNLHLFSSCKDICCSPGWKANLRQKLTTSNSADGGPHSHSLTDHYVADGVVCYKDRIVVPVQPREQLLEKHSYLKIFK